jgi:hypothetical protein
LSVRISERIDVISLGIVDLLSTSRW